MSKLAQYSLKTERLAFTVSISAFSLILERASPDMEQRTP